MTQREEALYAAFMAKDRRFDGRFFVGISTTKVFCRPICRARRAKAANCAFFKTAAEAQQAGYRPCLLCRPELAPGMSAADATSRLASRAARLLETSCASGESLEELAERLGCTTRHLRRVFAAEYRVTPAAYLQSCRLLLAKGLLTDTGLTVLEIAMAAGFGSLRGMNSLFKSRYGLSPTALRGRARLGGAPGSGISLALSYRPPYPFERMLDFLQGRAIPGVEKVEGGNYFRVARLRGRGGAWHTGWLEVSRLPGQDALRVRLSEGLAPVLPQALSRVKRLFDLYCDPERVGAVLKRMDDFRPGLWQNGIRLPGCFEPFETAARAILGQQVTVKTASAIAGRLAEALGHRVETGLQGLTRAFPEAVDILALGDAAQDRMGALGVTGARGRCIHTLAAALVNGEVTLDERADPEEEINRLLAIKGIGNWTAQYIAMRVLGWPDAFLETDAGVRQALPGLKPGEMLELAEAWRPFRSYAVMCLWNSLK